MPDCLVLSWLLGQQISARATVRVLRIWTLAGAAAHLYGQLRSVIARTAMAAAVALFSTPSFTNTCSRCLFTVCGFMPRISLILRVGNARFSSALAFIAVAD